MLSSSFRRFMSASRRARPSRHYCSRQRGPFRPAELAHARAWSRHQSSSLSATYTAGAVPRSLGARVGFIDGRDRRRRGQVNGSLGCGHVSAARPVARGKCVLALAIQMTTFERQVKLTFYRRVCCTTLRAIEQTISHRQSKDCQRSTCT
jgi:hypothetical protein